MISRCITENSGFGIVAKIKNEFATVGCFVRISDFITTKQKKDFDIVVHGLSRFKMHGWEMHPDGYFVAEVEDYIDLNNEPDYLLLENLKEKFETLIDKVNFKVEDAFWQKFEGSSKKSFKIAEKSGLTLIQQQELLSLRDENKRVAYLLEHFEKLNKQITENAAMRSIIVNDGYIN